MNELSENQGRSIQRPPARCPNCGAVLHPAFYFCMACATPYKPVEAITGRFGNFEPVTESDLIKSKVPQVWPLFWSYVVVVFIVSILFFLAGGEDSAYAQLMILASVLLTAVTVFFACRFWTSLAVQFKKIGIFSRYAAIATAGMAGLLVINYVYHYLILQSLPGLEEATSRFEELGPAALLIFWCIVPGVIEEVAFRGLIQHWLAAAINPIRALLLASALFTALHFSVLSGPYIFAVGMLLGWVKLKTGSLYPSMLLHFVHNAVAIFVFPLVTG